MQNSRAKKKKIVQLYSCKASIFLLQMEIKSISAYTIFFYKIVTITTVWEWDYLFYGL